MKEFFVDVRTILCCMRKNPEWYDEKQNLIQIDRKNKISVSLFLFFCFCHGLSRTISLVQMTKVGVYLNEKNDILIKAMSEI